MLLVLNIGSQAIQTLPYETHWFNQYKRNCSCTIEPLPTFLSNILRSFQRLTLIGIFNLPTHREKNIAIAGVKRNVDESVYDNI